MIEQQMNQSFKEGVVFSSNKLFGFLSVAKSPKKQSVGVYFWQYGAVFWVGN